MSTRDALVRFEKAGDLDSRLRGNDETGMDRRDGGGLPLRFDGLTTNGRAGRAGRPRCFTSATVCWYRLATV